MIQLPESLAEDRELRRFHAELAAMASEYAVLLNSLSEPILRLDVEGRVQFLNPAAARLLGQSPEEVRGRTFHDACHVPTPRPPVAVCACCTAIAQGLPFRSDREVLYVNGSLEIPVECVVSPLVDGKRAAGSVVVLFDLRERRRAEEARLAEAARAREVVHLREMLRLKEEFLNVAAHELNTPLTPILLQMAVLRKRTKGRGEYDVSWDIMQRNLQRLSSIVSDMLESARLHSGTLGLHKVEVDLGAVLTEAAVSYGENAREAGVEVKLACPGGMWVLGDRNRLTQVASNLLSNALKFSARGGRIHVGVTSEDREVRVTVRDEGVGLDPAQLDHLFKPFSRVPSPRTPVAHGTGLGLYICKGIVEAHGGRIWADSAGLDQGATFYFTIPAHAAVAAVVPQVPPARMPR